MWKKVRKLLPSSKAKTAKADESSFALKRVSDLREGPNVVDVVFVHGLGGDATGTWTRDAFWPNWLEEDSVSIQAWALQWPAKKFSWLRGDSMAVQDRTVAVLELLQAHGVGSRSLIFCCHSLGGVLVKAMLREASTMNKPDWQKVVASTKGVVFLATPHTGADLARIGSALGGSVLVRQLERSDPHLREINRWFRQNTPNLGVAVKAFIETQPFMGQMIVDESSADPNVEGCIPIGIDADHFEICKPDSRQDLVYSLILAFINEIVSVNHELVRLPPKVAHFFDFYLKSETTPVPFGGRKKVFSFLNDWLNESKRPHRLLITGLAGRGKSALLVHWANSLRVENLDWSVVFVPISMRFDTNRPVTFYKLWLDQILSLTGESEVELPPFGHEEFFATTLVEKIKSRASKMIIVVDGLDETLGQRFDEALFSTSLPSNVRLIVAARLQAGDNDSKGWLRRLSWQGPINAETYDLKALTLDETRDVILSWASGAKIEKGIVSELFRLTEGEPLLLSLYLDEMGLLMLQGDLDAETLVRLAPGFGAYFKRWLEDQFQSLRDARRDYDEHAVDMVLAILGCALGPITANDLISIFSLIGGGAVPFSSDYLVRPIARFVMGDGSPGNGYVLNHPRFGEYLREEYLSKSGVEAAEDAFLSWCGDYCLRVEEKKLLHDQVPPYVLQFYVSHLDKSNRSWREYSALISKGFKDAWEHYEGGSSGFSSTMRSVLERLNRTDHTDDTVGVILAQISASSCLASVSSVGRNLSAGMLSLALREKVWTPLQVVSFIDLHPPENRAGLFSATINYFDGEDLERALSELLAPVLDPQKAENRAQYLVRALGKAPALRSRLLSICREAVEKLSDPYRRIVLQIELAEYDPEMKLLLLQKALSSVPLCKLNQHVLLYGRLFHSFSRADEAEKAESALRSALQGVDNEAKQGVRINILLQLYNVLPDKDVVSRLKPYIEYCRLTFERSLKPLPVSKNSSFDVFEAEHLCARYAKVCIVCGEWSTESIINELNSNVKRIGRDHHEISVLIEVLPFCSKPIKDELAAVCLERAKTLTSGNNRAHAIVGIGNNVSAVGADAAQECVGSAQLIEDRNSLIHCCISLFGYLSPKAQFDLLPRLIEIIKPVVYVLDKGEFLVLLAKHLPSSIAFDFFKTGVNLMSLAWDYRFRISKLRCCLKYLPDQLKQLVFEELFKYEAERNFEGALHYGVLASGAPELWSKDLLDHLLKMTDGYDPEAKAYLFSRLAPLLIRFGYNEKLNEALPLAMGIQKKRNRGGALAGLIPYLDEGKREAIADYCGNELKDGDPHNGLRIADVIEYMSSEIRDQTVLYWADIAMSDQDVVNWRLLKKVSSFFEREKRDCTIEHLFSWALSLPVNKLSEVASELMPLLSLEKKLTVIGKLFNGNLAPRSTYFAAIGNSAPIFQVLGGDDLIKDIIAAMETVTEWWP